MHRTRTILAFILIATGLVWIGQGSGALKGSSFMVGDPTWIGIGLGGIAAGLVLGWLELRARRA